MVIQFRMPFFCKYSMLFLFSMVTANEAAAMSMFGKNVMFSEVTGVVTLNNVPVNNAEIERYYIWAWDDKKETDKTVTDEKGFFRLPQQDKGGGVSSLLPHEPVISQKIIIRYNGQEYTAWQHTKHNYDKDGELKGRKLMLSCELSNEYKNDGVYFGICTIND